MIPEAELRRLETVRAATLALVDGLSQEVMDRRPRAGGWSVGEVLDHLRRAEASNRADIAALVAEAKAGRRPYLRRQLTAAGLTPAFVPRGLLPLLSAPFALATALAPYSLREFVVRNRLFPASTSREMEPERGRPAAALRAELRRSVAETRALFLADPELDFSRMVCQHPLLGANDVPQILLLTAAHEARHQDQIRNLLRIAA